MSEYRYYEFQAIDRPLTTKVIALLRSCSTGALFLQGFSGVKSHGLSDGHYSEVLPYASREGRSTYEWFDPALHIAVRYSAEGRRTRRHGERGCRRRMGFLDACSGIRRGLSSR
jgi:hypothetical protein